jgi:hypothetical protein
MMTTMSPSRYVIEMRQIEEQRNAAARLGDRMAMQTLLERSATLNRLFFRRGQA